MYIFGTHFIHFLSSKGTKTKDAPFLERRDVLDSIKNPKICLFKWPSFRQLVTFTKGIAKIIFNNKAVLRNFKYLAENSLRKKERQRLVSSFSMLFSSGICKPLK